MQIKKGLFVNKYIKIHFFQFQLWMGEYCIIQWKTQLNPTGPERNFSKEFIINIVLPAGFNQGFKAMHN